MQVLDRPTDEDRAAFRQSLRGFLARQGPQEHAVASGAQVAALRQVVSALSQQGVTALGADPELGGLAEIGLAMQELGRATCRAPVLAPMLLSLLACTYPSLREPLQPHLNLWHTGDRLLCLALGSEDPDPSSGSVSLDNGTLTGTLSYVQGALASHQMLVAVSSTLVALVDLRHDTVGMRETPLMDMPGLCAVTLKQTPVTVISPGNEVVSSLVTLAGLAAASRAYGAAGG